MNSSSETRTASYERFVDRRDAGLRLAEVLRPVVVDPRFLSSQGASLRQSLIVLALPRGGVPVAQEVAHAFDIEWDVLIVRKIGHPRNEEFGIGAMSEDLTYHLNQLRPEDRDFSAEELEQIIEEERNRVRLRKLRYRGNRAFPDIKGRTVLLVDDGLATGVTALEALRDVRSRGARCVVLCVPVCPAQALPVLRKAFDEVVCVRAPRDFAAVGLWYRHFPQVSDEEVVRALKDRESALRAEEPSNVRSTAQSMIARGAKGSAPFGI